MYFQTKKLINKFKKKISSHSGCCEQKHKNERDDQKSIISDYLGQRKVLLEKEGSKFHFPRNPQYSWERFPLYKNSLFPDLKNFAWLDGDHVDEKFIRSRLGEGKSDKDVEICRKFSEQGYVIIEGLFSPELLDGIWTELEGAVEREEVWNTEGEFLESDEFSLYAKGRILNIHKLVPAFNECFRHEKLIRILEMLLGKEVLPFQTINSFYGSEQAAHSDAVHMTTFPLGFMIAAWVAFEDLDDECGPLIFYPGSHKLEYKMSESISEDLHFENHAYEEFIKEHIKKNDLQPAYFAPCKKGDLLIWHHNLIHGGSEINDKKKTRKSLVSHYFAKDVIAYHEVTGRKLENYDPYEVVAQKK